jgi:glutamate-1-semialdehyde 2,1-aminomutase
MDPPMPRDEINSQLDRLLADTYPSWIAFYKEAASLLPSGVAHDGRYAGGAPVLPAVSGRGPYKRDIDGNEFLDYWMGHGALILGHSHPDIVAAIESQAGKLTHAGGCHPLEHRWAKLVIDLIPSAQRVRFVNSGTEAVMLALRLARAHTGRDRILKLDGHFHGWSDFTLLGVEPPFDRPSGGGYSLGALAGTTCVAANAKAIGDALATREYAALIMEPTGASGGAIPLDAGFLEEARALSREHGTVLIFDEVITAFRVAPGGVQQVSGVIPDLTCLAKILVGGLPGGAVTGAEEIMNHLAYSGDKERDRSHRVAHWGTFNANPLAAATGSACLELIRSGEPCEQAAAFARDFRSGINDLFRKRDIPWCAYGGDSILHVCTDATDCARLTDCDRSHCSAAADRLKAKRPADMWLKKALWLEGVDWPGGKQAWTSATHGEAELELTIGAFDAATKRLRSLGAAL